MKILTKKWAEKHEQVEFIHSLKEFEKQKHTYKDIENKSKSNFNQDIKKDAELLKVCLKTNIADKLYQAKIERDRKLGFGLQIGNNGNWKFIQCLLVHKSPRSELAVESSKT